MFCFIANGRIDVNQQWYHWLIDPHVVSGSVRAHKRYKTWPSKANSGTNTIKNFMDLQLYIRLTSVYNVRILFIWSSFEISEVREDIMEARLLIRFYRGNKGAFKRYNFQFNFK